MDIFSMLQNATIEDVNSGDAAVGVSIGFEVVNGRMRIKAIIFDSESETDDPDDGEEADIPEKSEKVQDADAGADDRVVFPDLKLVGGNG